jgi:hypothetical protein
MTVYAALVLLAQARESQAHGSQAHGSEGNGCGIPLDGLLTLRRSAWFACPARRQRS